MVLSIFGVQFRLLLCDSHLIDIYQFFLLQHSRTSRSNSLKLLKSAKRTNEQFQNHLKISVFPFSNDVILLCLLHGFITHNFYFHEKILFLKCYAFMKRSYFQDIQLFVRNIKLSVIYDYIHGLPLNYSVYFSMFHQLLCF